MKLKDMVYIMVLIAFFVIGFLSKNELAFGMVLSIFFISIIYFSFKLSENIYILVFLISFFTFLLGGEMLNLLEVTETKYLFPLNINVDAYHKLLVSLLSLFISYIAFKTLDKNDKIVVNNNIVETEKIKILRKVSLVFFYILIIAKVFKDMSFLLFSIESGYSSIYSEYSFQGPTFLIKVAQMGITSFFVFLSTLPSKKECRIPVLLYLSTSGITFIAGKRNELIVAILLIIVYYAYRNIYYNNGEKWLSKKFIITLGLLSPLVLGILYSINELRSNELSNISLNYFDGVIKFFYQQGFSINIIKWGEQLEHYIPDRYYSLGQTYEFFTTNNFISKILFDFKVYSGQTVERALEGHRFSYLLSYLVFPWSYERGYGVGSSYIAEVFHDFGYMGLVIFNSIYGYLFAKFNSMRFIGPFKMTLTFIVMQELIMAPRSYADSFVSSVLDFSNLEILLLIWVVSNVLYNEKKNKKLLI